MAKKNHEKSQNFHFFFHFFIFWKKEMEKEHHEWDGQVKMKNMDPTNVNHVHIICN
jgi:hypothetical protein